MTIQQIRNDLNCSKGIINSCVFIIESLKRINAAPSASVTKRREHLEKLMSTNTKKMNYLHTLLSEEVEKQANLPG
jgi:hypothetical protein